MTYGHGVAIRAPVSERGTLMKDDITLLVVLLNKRPFTEMRLPRTWSRCTNMQVSLTFHVFWHIFTNV